MSFSTVSLGFRHHNRWQEISCFPAFTILVSSVLFFSAACLTVLMKAFTGQRPCPLWRQADRKQASSDFPSSFFVCHCWCWSVVSVASPKSLQSLVRWRKIYELRGGHQIRLSCLSLSLVCARLKSLAVRPPTHSPSCTSRLWQSSSALSGWWPDVTVWYTSARWLKVNATWSETVYPLCFFSDY